MTKEYHVGISISATVDWLSKGNIEAGLEKIAHPHIPHFRTSWGPYEPRIKSGEVGKDYIQTKTGNKVFLWGELLKFPDPSSLHDLIIAVEHDSSVTNRKSSGSVIARLGSYGLECYRDESVADCGYAFDIPGFVTRESVRDYLGWYTEYDFDASYALKFMTDDAVLEAIVERNERKIRDAVRDLNRTLDKPIICTDYLSEALERPANGE